MELWEIKDKYPLREYLEEKGAKFNKQDKACCIFHADNDPSMTITGERFYCFGCKEGGDLFDAVGLLNNCKGDLSRQIKVLAEEKGIELTPQTPEQQERQKQTRTTQEILFLATEFWHKRLLEEKKVLKIVKERGVNDKTIIDLKIGYTSGDLLKHLKQNGCKNEEIEKTGLFIKTKNGDLLNFFNNRIFFPYWKTGRVVYGIARKTPYTPDNEYEKQKYKKLLIHSEKRPYVLTENKYIYNEECINKNPEFMIITEGIIDSILLQQLELPVISPITTKFQDNDVKKLVKLCERINEIYIMNDNEENKEGLKGALKTARILTEKEKLVKIVIIPKGEGINKIDVADYVSQGHSKKEVLELCKSAKDYIEYLIEGLQRDKRLLNKNLNKEGIIELIKLQDDISQEYYREKISKIFNISPAKVKKLFKEEKNNEKSNKKRETKAETLLRVEIFLKEKYQFRFNEITQKPEIQQPKKKWESVTDQVFSQIYFELTKADILFSQQDLQQLIISPHFSRPYNPFLEYFNNLSEWDGIDYIKEFTNCFELKNEEDSQTFNRYFKKWFVGTLTGVYDAEWCNHCVFIISGEQGEGKSTILNKLIPPQLKDYLQVGGVDFGTKDSKMVMCSKLLINIDELESFNKKDVDTLKSAITTKYFDLRPPYGKFLHKYVKRCSFMASTNRTSFLTDPTGSRRFLIFEVGRVDYEGKFDIEKMYSQAKHLYNSNEFTYYFSKEEIQIINKNNERYSTDSLEEQLLLTYFTQITYDETKQYTDSERNLERIYYLTTTEIGLKLADLSNSKINTNNIFVRRLGGYLKKHKFERISKRNQYRWCVQRVNPGEEDEETEIIEPEEVSYGEQFFCVN